MERMKGMVKSEIILVDSNTQSHYAAVTQSNCITKKVPVELYMYRFVHKNALLFIPLLFKMEEMDFQIEISIFL